MRLNVGLLLSFLVVCDAFAPTTHRRRSLVRPLMAEEAPEAADDSADEETVVDPIEAQEEVIEEYRKNLSFKRTGVKESEVSNRSRRIPMV